MQKRLFFFDIDGTLFSEKYKKIWPQTVKLIKQLAENPNNILGIATGRSKYNLDVIKDIKHLFRYFVLANGAFTIEKETFLDENPISSDITHKLVTHIYHHNYDQVVLTTDGIEQSAFYFNKTKNNANLVDNITNRFDIHSINKDCEFYLKEKIFLLHIFGPNKLKLKPFIEEMNCFQAYYWDAHIDLTLKNINKFASIKKIKNQYSDYQLVCMGDGSNDIEMLRHADIGISMGNSHYPFIHSVADLKTPHIDKNEIFDFFKENNLI